MLEDVLQAVGGKSGFGRRRADPFSFDQAQKRFEVGKGYFGEAAVLANRTAGVAVELAFWLLFRSRSNSRLVDDYEPTVKAF